MRVVVDTNVLVSGLLSPHGVPGRVVDILLTGQLILLVDDRILAEYQEVLSRPKFAFRTEDVAEVLSYLEAIAERVSAPPLALGLPDPDDLPFLEVAAAGYADALVTGNPRHYDPRSARHDVRIVSPAQLLALLGGSG